jgi:hypothetical protein
MQLQTMRDTLRGWLQDKIPTGGSDADRQWSNSNLRKFINLGLRDAEKIIVAVDPEVSKCTYVSTPRIPSTGVDALQSWPVGTWAVCEVALSTDGINYTPIRRITLREARQGKTGFVPYSKAYFMLAPTPTSAVTDGLRVIVLPTWIMADDTDECPAPVANETLVMKLAQKYALMDVGEPTDKLEQEISALEQRVPRFYLVGNEPAFVEPIGFADDDYRIS